MDMRRSAENYAAIFDPTDAIWRTYSFRARQSVSGLSIIGASQLYPVILAALEKFSRQEMGEIAPFIGGYRGAISISHSG